MILSLRFSEHENNPFLPPLPVFMICWIINEYLFPILLFNVFALEVSIAYYS